MKKGFRMQSKQTLNKKINDSKVFLAAPACSVPYVILWVSLEHWVGTYCYHAYSLTHNFNEYESHSIAQIQDYFMLPTKLLLRHVLRFNSNMMVYLWKTKTSSKGPWVTVRYLYKWISKMKFCHLFWTERS